MGPVRVLILVVALAAAVGAVVLVRGMSKAQAPQVVAAAPAAQAPEKPMAQVLVAKRDLPAGTKLAAEDMTWQAWPQDSLNAAFIVRTGGPAPAAPESNTGKAVAAAAEIAKAALTTDDQLQGMVDSVVREPLLAGEPMTERKVVKAGTAGILAISLEPGMRAMAIPLSAESAAGGFILPGDHVDVVQTRQLDGAGISGKRFVSTTVLKNVKVLAIDQNTLGPKEGVAVVGATATVELTSSQAEVLALAKAQGDLALVLRSYADAAGPAVTTMAQNDALDTGFNASVVRVYRNGSATGSTTEVTVTR
jgi:pilus assembly protein CpaB